MKLNLFKIKKAPAMLSLAAVVIGLALPGTLHATDIHDVAVALGSTKTTDALTIQAASPANLQAAIKTVTTGYGASATEALVTDILNTLLSTKRATGASFVATGATQGYLAASGTDAAVVALIADNAFHPTGATLTYVNKLAVLKGIAGVNTLSVTPVSGAVVGVAGKLVLTLTDPLEKVKLSMDATKLLTSADDGALIASEIAAQLTNTTDKASVAFNVAASVIKPGGVSTKLASKSDEIVKAVAQTITTGGTILADRLLVADTVAAKQFAYADKIAYILANDLYPGDVTNQTNIAVSVAQAASKYANAVAGKVASLFSSAADQASLAGQVADNVDPKLASKIAVSVVNAVTSGTATIDGDKARVAAAVVAAQADLDKLVQALAVQKALLKLTDIGDSGQIAISGSIAASISAVPLSSVTDNLLAKNAAKLLTDANDAAALAKAIADNTSAAADKAIIAVTVAGSSIPNGLDKLKLSDQSAAIVKAISQGITGGSILADQITVACAVAKKQALQAASVANGVAQLHTGLVADQIAIALTVSGTVPKQGAAISTTVLGTAISDTLLTPGGAGYLTTSSTFAGLAARFAQGIPLYGADIVGAAALSSGSNVAVTNLFRVADVFGHALDAAASATKITYANAKGAAKGVGTDLQSIINATANTDTKAVLAEQFASVAVALAHFIPATDATDITNVTAMAAVITTLGTINNQATPDVLGAILSELFARTGGTATTFTSKSPLVTKLLAAANGVKGLLPATKLNIKAVMTDLFDAAKNSDGSFGFGNTNPYGTYGTLSGEETPVHNG